MSEAAPDTPQKHLIETTFTNADLGLLMEQKKVTDKLKDTVVVVIDVLRFTSNVAGAFVVGAKKIVPVTSPAEAFRVAEELRARGETVVVAAEQGGSIVEGAQRGNSPRYELGSMEGKTLVISTSHGTHTLHAAKGAAEVILASFLNAPAVIEHLRRIGKDVVLATSGSKYSDTPKTIESKDDCLVAAMLSQGLTEKEGIHELPKDQTCLLDTRDRLFRVVQIHPATMMAKLNAELARDGVEKALRGTRWGRHILDLDTKNGNDENAKDIAYLSQVGICDLVPVLNSQGEVVLLK